MDKKALDAMLKEANTMGVPEVVEGLVTTEPAKAPKRSKLGSCLDRKGIKNRKQKNKAAKKARRRNRKKK